MPTPPTRPAQPPNRSLHHHARPSRGSVLAGEQDVGDLWLNSMTAVGIFVAERSASKPYNVRRRDQTSRDRPAVRRNWRAVPDYARCRGGFDELADPAVEVLRRSGSGGGEPTSCDQFEGLLDELGAQPAPQDHERRHQALCPAVGGFNRRRQRGRQGTNGCGSATICRALPRTRTSPDIAVLSRRRSAALVGPLPRRRP